MISLSGLWRGVLDEAGDFSRFCGSWGRLGEPLERDLPRDLAPQVQRHDEREAEQQGEQARSCHDQDPFNETRNATRSANSAELSVFL